MVTLFKAAGATELAIANKEMNNAEKIPAGENNCSATPCPVPIFANNAAVMPIIAARPLITSTNFFIPVIFVISSAKFTSPMDIISAAFTDPAKFASIIPAFETRASYFCENLSETSGKSSADNVNAYTFPSMFRVVERSKLSRKFGNETFMDCHLSSSEEEEDEFVAETLRTMILLDVDDDDDFERDDFDDDDDDFEENTTGDDFVAAPSNILKKSAKVKDFCAKCECDCCGRECVVFTRERRRRRNRRRVSLKFRVV